MSRGLGDSRAIDLFTYTKCDFVESPGGGYIVHSSSMPKMSRIQQDRYDCGQIAFG